MAESSSVFDADPTLLAPSQRIAQAHAAMSNEMDLVSEQSQTEEADSNEHTKTQVQVNGKGREVDVNDESAFPSLGGASTTKPKSLWGTMRTVKPQVSASSQVVSASDLVTEVLKLENDQQQARSLGKNQTGTVVTMVQKATGTTIQMSTASKTGTTTFLIKGKPEAVQDARKSLLKELGKKIVLKVLVPNSVRPYIIGSKGRTLKTIIDRTGAKVQLPKREDTGTSDVADPEEMVEVTIEGDFQGANQARKEIEAIVSERTSSTSIKITSIPSDFYGLLSLQQGELESTQDLKIKIPSPSFTDDIPMAITITGEKTAVAEAKERLESIYEDLRRMTIPTSFPVARKQHRFIAAALPQILQSTGCAVVVPPPSSSSDHITIRGPAANIGAGITMVVDKAQSMAVESLEISRAHPSAASQLQHAVDITNYLRKSEQLTLLEKEHSVGITIPSESDLSSAGKVTFDISGKSQTGVTDARKAMVDLINTLTPNRVRRLEIEPLLHKQVVGGKNKNVSNLRKQHGVEICLPAIEIDSSIIVLVYIGSSKNVEEISAALSETAAAISSIASSAGTIVSEVVSIPSKHHSVITGKNNTTLNAITGGADSVVRVTFSQTEPDTITVRGPKNDVIRVVADIKDVVHKAESSEIANSHRIEFDFPAQFTKNLIGKGGANISKIREELGVRIDVGDEGKIIVQGPQRNAEEAKSRITLLGDRLADETTFKLKIPSEFHGQIIGQGGKFVKRLEDKYQVQINFPRTSSEGEVEDEKIGRNEVIIKGGKRGATSAKNEVMELFEYENEHSYSTTIEVLQRAVAQIVGKGGAAINELKDETNTKIDIDREASSSEEPDARVSVTITGKKSQVEIAKSEILKINEEVQDTVTKTLTVDPAFHRNLIGSGGSSIRDLVIRAGGPDDAALRARMVRFPRAGVDSNEIVLKGPQKVVEKIAKAIEKIVGDAGSQYSEVTKVPKEQVRIIIGRGGSKKQELESTFSVTIDIPRAESTTEADMPIKVLGAKDHVAKAIQEITRLVRIPESETVQIPRKCHRQVADNGAFIRRLRTDYKISVDHDGHALPRATAKTAPAQSNAARIDDEEANGAEAAWSVVELTSDEQGDIPWVLKGDAAQIAKAKKLISAAIAQASSQTHIGYLSIPSAKHRFIIGQGGSTINNIRESSGTKIDVPRNQGDEIIVIKGSINGLEQAKSMILEATTAPSGKRREY